MTNTADFKALADGETRILIIDDEPGIVGVLTKGLGKRYACRGVTSAGEALECLRDETYALVLSDIMMPGITGLQLLSVIKEQYPQTVVILVSASLEIGAAIEALRGGAFDYITKPFVMPFVETVVERALRHQRLLMASRFYEEHLEEMVRVQTQELRLSNLELNTALDRLYGNYRATLKSLAAALEARDVETRGHSDRVVAYCLRLGRELGLVNGDLVTLENGALLHDLGKIGVPDAVLFKEGALTDDEWQLMRHHVEFGAQIIQGIDFLTGASQIVSQHHERYDGSGYPNRLTGDLICMGARIFAVADAADAITSDRPYRRGRPFDAAAEELLNCSGKHFDPTVVDAFLRVPLDEWRELRQLALAPGPTLRRADGRELQYSRLLVEGSRAIGG